MAECIRACVGCSFAGEVNPISKATPVVAEHPAGPSQWEVSFVQNQGTPEERRTGTVVVDLGESGDYKGEQDAIAAVRFTTGAIARCPTNNTIEHTVRRAVPRRMIGSFGFGGMVQTCVAFAKPGYRGNAIYLNKGVGGLTNADGEQIV